jgi:hypothetical protein
MKENDKRIGNQFWKLRSKHGRDKIFKTPDLMWDAACEYFAWIQDNPLLEQEVVKYKDYYEIITLEKMRAFTLTGLCLYLDVNTAYFNQFEDELKGKTDDLSKDFSKVITRIRETLYTQKFEGAASGFLNPNIIARDLGLIDKSDLTTKGEKIGINLPTWMNDEQAES